MKKLKIVSTTPHAEPSRGLPGHLIRLRHLLPIRCGEGKSDGRGWRRFLPIGCGEGIRILLMSVCVVCLVPRALAFGHEGHEAVAILALQKLHADKAANNPKATAALQHIASLLGNEDMAAVAVWADWVRLKDTNHL